MSPVGVRWFVHQKSSFMPESWWKSIEQVGVSASEVCTPYDFADKA
jgi:hypothetical protein